MSWEVEFTDDFERWYRGLEEGTQDRIIAAMQVLRDQGPRLGRPLVDSVKGSKHPMIPSKARNIR